MALSAIIAILDGAIPSTADVILRLMGVILSEAKDLTQQEGLDERRFSN